MLTMSFRLAVILDNYDNGRCIIQLKSQQYPECLEWHGQNSIFCLMDIAPLKNAIVSFSFR